MDTPTIDFVLDDETIKGWIDHTMENIEKAKSQRRTILFLTTDQTLLFNKLLREEGSAFTYTQDNTGHIKPDSPRAT